MKKKINLLLLLIPLFSLFSFGQSNVIDGVIATVGNQIILKSDLEKIYVQSFNDRNYVDKDDICVILEELIFQKMLVYQADVDSVVVTEPEVENELERRMKFYISQVGSTENLEAYYKKTIDEIKTEVRKNLKDQLIVRQMQGKIIDDVKITPSEVRSFFNSIPKDSLPVIPSEVEVAQIVKKPKITEETKKEVKNRLAKIKERIINGEDFSALAVMYSEDASSKKGGELGFYGRGELYPEFEVVAYNLKENELSDIVETKAGYHIIQLIKRKGEEVNVRHILLKPKLSIEESINVKMSLDSIYNMLVNKTISFDEAIQKYSDDISKQNGGMLINSESGSTKFRLNSIEDPTLKFTIENLKQEDFSKPILLKDAEGNDVYKIIYVETKTNEHKANLKDDYSIIQQEALVAKQNKIMKEWIASKKKGIFINISKEYSDCPFQNNWLK